MLELRLTCPIAGSDPPIGKETNVLTLISHPLCPYVQRAAIALAEKGASFERRDIDLAHKPAWFLALSPLGKTPVLLVDREPIFESAVILEFLEDTILPALHPDDPLTRARHRGWIEYASATLNDIAVLYSADSAAFPAKVAALRARFERLEGQLATGPWFSGDTFSLVDVAFAPVFRYFDVFDRLGDFGILTDKPKLASWRQQLRNRPSVAAAVQPGYDERLMSFLRARPSHLGHLAKRLELAAL